MVELTDNAVQAAAEALRRSPQDLLAGWEATVRCVINAALSTCDVRERYRVRGRIPGTPSTLTQVFDDRDVAVKKAAELNDARVTRLVFVTAAEEVATDGR